MKVELIDFWGGDGRAVQAARTSTLGAAASGEEERAGLINFLWREGHHVPFEHSGFTFRVECPIFVSRQIVKHRTCLSGSTRVQRTDRTGRSMGSVNNTIEKMWELWHVGARRQHQSGKEFYALLPNRKDMWVRSYNEETGVGHVSRVLDVVDSGQQETWAVRTENGHEIRTTMNHKFFTPDGWKRLRELQVGDYTFRQGKVAINDSPWIPPRLREGIALWSSAKRKQLISFKGENCYICNKHFEFADLELDHVVPVVDDLSAALNEDNLKPACRECHRKKTDSEQQIRPRLGSRRGIVPDKIVSISDPQVERTYDLVLEDPWHNFVAEGLVVHNSSISEESGRYRELDGVFYIPGDARPLAQTGRTGDYNMVPLLEARANYANSLMESATLDAWVAYQALLEIGVAKEAARMVLPVNTYSSMYLTMNARNLIHFLSLRNEHHAQWETREVAKQMEDIFADKMPLTWKAVNGEPT